MLALRSDCMGGCGGSLASYLEEKERVLEHVAF